MKKMCVSKYRRFYIILVIGAAFFSFLAQNSPARQNEEKQIAELLRQNARAIEQGDLAALDKIWSNDESVTVFESGYANYGWTDYRDNHLAPELKEYKNLKYSFSDLKIKTNGKTAWATFKYALSADVGGRHVDGAGLGTAILEKRGKQWQIVHMHTSAGY